jgi:hypothetical protein
MSLSKLQDKIATYDARGWVKVTTNSFERVCRLVVPREGAAGTDPVADQRSISAKLFLIIGSQGRTSAATALFSSYAQVQHLVHVSWRDVNWFAEHPARTSISSMYNNRGFPVRSDVERLEGWVAENASSDQKRGLLSSITGMQNGRGVPKSSDLNDLKTWCIDNSSQGEWMGLLSSITGMQNGRGVPRFSDLDTIAHAGRLFF